MISDFSIEPYEEAEWRQITEEFSDLNLLQTWAFGQAKQAIGPWTVERGVFSDGSEIFGACQVMVRKIPIVGGGLAWINRGPLWQKTGVGEDSVTLAPFMTRLREYYVARRGFYLRIAPNCTETPDIDDFTRLDQLGWASSVIDLTPPPEEIRKALNQNWRRFLKKGERNGLIVENGEDGAIFDEFLSDHEQFLREKGFQTNVDTQLISQIQAHSHPTNKIEVFRARTEGGERVASIAVARYGNSCEYLAANSNDLGRKLNAGQVLVWRIIVEMNGRGIAKLDMGGMDPELTPPGVYRFKSGLNGSPYRLASEIEAGGKSVVGRLIRWRVENARKASCDS